MEMVCNGENDKKHAVCIPFPIQGHINPMMKLACLLHHKGFHITFVHTEANYNRLLESRGPDALEGLPDFKFVSILDGQQPAMQNGDTGDKVSVHDDIASVGKSIRKNGLLAVNELMRKLNEDTTSPVTCIFADMAMCFAVDAAEANGVPCVLVQTASACSSSCVLLVSQLLENGLLPLKDEKCFTNGYLDTVVDWIPGMIPLRLKDFPNFLLTADPNYPFLKMILSENARASKASATIINTFDELESGALTANRSLTSNIHPLYAIGPFHLLCDKLIPESNNLKWMTSSLWHLDHECLEWLDSKPLNSIIYVNFGSTTELTHSQVSEFAWGLADSKKNFLLVIRPDLVRGEKSMLPPEFWEELGGRGHVAGWCPQEEVLAHPSIGVFLTHCGWNSIMESICSGVPMLCWPFFADQRVNCKYVCDEWGIGMEISNDVKREEVGNLVSELLDGENGKAMKRKAMEWKEKAAQAVSDGGSSHSNFQNLINQLSSVRLKS